MLNASTTIMDALIEHRIRFVLATLVITSTFLSGCSDELGGFSSCKGTTIEVQNMLYSFNLDTPAQSEIIAYFGNEGSKVANIRPGRSGNDFIMTSGNKIFHISMLTSPVTKTIYTIPNASSLMISPDGGKFMHGTDNVKRITIVDTMGQFITMVPILSSVTRVHYTQWANDRTLAFFAHDSVSGKGVYLTDINTGNVTKIYSVDDSGGFDLSPDLQTLVVSEVRTDDQGNSRLTIAHVDLATGSKIDLANGSNPKIVVGGQKVLYKNGSYLSLVDMHGNKSDLLLHDHWIHPYSLSTDSNSIIAAVQVGESTQIKWVDLRDERTVDMGTVADFKTVVAPHWDTVESKLHSPFLAADGNKAFVFVYRYYYSDGCPN
jgi:hypothetical protein